MKLFKRFLSMFDKEVIKEEVKREDRYVDYLIARDELRDKFEDERLINQYKREIEKDAQHYYDFLLYSSDHIYLNPNPKIRYVARNHNEIFPKEHKVYVDEAFKKLWDKHTEEEKKQILEDRQKRIWGENYEFIKNLVKESKENG